MQRRSTCTSDPLTLTDRSTSTSIPNQDRGRVGNSKRTEQAHTHRHGQARPLTTGGDTIR